MLLVSYIENVKKENWHWKAQL